MNEKTKTLLGPSLRDIERARREQLVLNYYGKIMATDEGKSAARTAVCDKIGAIIGMTGAGVRGILIRLEASGQIPSRDD